MLIHCFGLAYVPEDVAQPHLDEAHLKRVFGDWCPPYSATISYGRLPFFLGLGSPYDANTYPGRSTEHYRQEAARLRREADEAKNIAIRQQLLAVADSYDGLAETVEITTRR